MVMMFESSWEDSCSVRILRAVEDVCGMKKVRNGKRGDAQWTTKLVRE